MSRFADLLAAVAVLVGLTLAMPLTARAETIVPTPLPAPDEYRTVALGPRSFPITPVTQDLAGVAESAVSKKRIDVRIDANVAFTRDSAAIRPEARHRLAQIASQLAAVPPGTITIEGHTDDLGSAEHGMTLSRQRARAVQTVLGEALRRHDVRVTGKGEDEPLVENRDEASRARNRRVELAYRAR
ncbi:OmpA family protein [Luteococcus sp. OSA5]|uniref:OmpA family protein n=1 Tax=Luteococcus sp. OSA5 TaxID=3401630 RepID=UPI003B43D5EB